LNDVAALNDLLPVVLLLLFGIGTAVASRLLRISPVVGYIALGCAFHASGLRVPFGLSTLSTLAQLGVVFLLFDVGLHFPLKQIRERATDIFAFGPVQVLFATVALGAVARLLGLSWANAALVGVILSMSSTAVVARLIRERHQQNCPVGQTATAILIFQDVVAILVLIVASSIGRPQAFTSVVSIALVKAILAFALTTIIAKVAVRPILAFVAHERSEEIFTATALLIALAAGWATERVGLSVTLGGFLGGVALAETPFTTIIRSEITPFRGLLLGFFFIYVGFLVDTAQLLHAWWAVLLVASGFIGVKLLTNMAASRMFRWSVPGSMQLGFLLAQGSEFGFVIFTLPAVRARLGEAPASILVAAITLSLGVTPTLAELGRSLAGRLRARLARPASHELIPSGAAAPVLIVGMGEVGRMVADALTQFGIDYFAIEQDSRRLQNAIADGYQVSLGDSTDPHAWDSVQMQERKISVITAPRLEFLKTTNSAMTAYFPSLTRIAAIRDEAEAKDFVAIGISPVLDRFKPRGVAVASAVLAQLGIPTSSIAEWRNRISAPATNQSELVSAPA
jgi:CPA2 family monovalent cation:H+ antiporter-2